MSYGKGMNGAEKQTIREGKSARSDGTYKISLVIRRGQSMGV